MVVARSAEIEALRALFSVPSMPEAVRVNMVCGEHLTLATFGTMA